MADPDHVRIVEQGAEEILRWRKAHPDETLDLYQANLSGANLYQANLSEADLFGANLSGANLYQADLSEVNLSGVRLFETTLSNTNLTAAQGLETCHHTGPSTLDHRTLLLSGGLPEIFLRGCGWPDELIAVVPVLLQNPIQFYSCFISYSSQDEDFAKRLYADLWAHGVRCYFAPEDMQGGRKLHEQIDQAIQVLDKLLLVLSPHSIASNWVEFELRRARRRELRDQCRVLFPVRLVDYAALRDWECFDADTGRDLATEVREYFIPDFTHWKDHDAYQRAFKRLLRDLRIEMQSRHGPTERGNA